MSKKEQNSAGQVEPESADSTKGFLDTVLPADISQKSPEEVEALLNQLSEQITPEQVEHQNELLENDVAEMKQFMDKAVSDGVLVDDTDENAEDGTILLKDKTGEYNPIGDLIAEKRAALDAKLAALEGDSGDAVKTTTTTTTASSSALSRDSIAAPASANAASPITFSQQNTANGVAPQQQQTAILKPVVLHIPISGDVPSNEVLRYASAAVQDCYTHGEAPVCPLLQSAVSVGFGQITEQARLVSVRTMVAVRQAIGELRVYVDCDRQKEFSGTFTSNTVLRSLDKQTQQELAQKQSGAAPLVAQEAPPDKTRINRYTRNADGEPVQQFPDGVAGVTLDGTEIPIDNSGKSFNPRVPNVLGDMEYRNALLATPKYDPKDWYYRRFDKNRYIVVAYMGPKNCNLKHENYYMCVFAAVRSKSECAAVISHIRKKKNCYHGKMFNLGVVDIGEWFATAPPRFAKDATASYSNPLHREYMESYINEQKRATVELEQRVLDDEVRAREKTNTMLEQLKNKGMNPDLAPNSAQVQQDIEEQKKENAKQALQHKRLAAEAARRKAAAETQEKQAARRRARAPIGPQSAEQRPDGVAESQNPAALVGGVRRARRGPPRGPPRMRGRGRGSAIARGRGRGRGPPQGTAIDF